MDNGCTQKGKRGRRPNSSGHGNADTRAVILHTARMMFADKGYDGTSVADIAERAGVNKALVFYYFSSKENILREVLDIAAGEATGRRELFLQNESPFSEDVISEYYDDALSTMESKREVIKILLAETIKDSGSGELLFDFLEKAMGDIPRKMSEHGFQVIDRDKLLTSEFFFDAMALFTFAALEKKWSDYSGIDRKKVREYFMEVFNKTYLSYISNNYYLNKGV